MNQAYERGTPPPPPVTKRQAAIVRLRAYLSVGDTVYGVVRSVSRTGTRTLDLYKLTDAGPTYLSGWVAQALGIKRVNSGALRSSDLFTIVYELGYSMWPDGFDCIGDRCPSNDHSNGHLTMHHANGGYALRSQSL